ncbi:uncharacterized protein DNG_04153 [Cephalotrichum gorgonifer]|uniref:DNA mismatch repair protein HSM3 N-terminal domain-containing protein n=1 Tax=Cephalotrichum gorgonifer TaxID=2041049 RepID=A0AAE8MVI9_9PEZI|nr:uncharacterized protein DNG_04153 [Cephalotrichum gorgonifer]
MADSRPQGDPASVGIPPLLAHLNSIVTDPTTPLEDPLFEKVQRELSFYSLPFPDNQSTYHTLLTHLISTLPVLADDAPLRTVTSLIDALIARMPISAVLSFVTPAMLIAALEAPHPAPNLLAADIIKRAQGREGARSVLREDVLSALITVWMNAPAVEVSQRGEEALLNLLEGTTPGLVDATRRLSLTDEDETMVDGINGSAHRPLDVWVYLLEGEGGDIIRRACVTDPGSRQASLSQNRLLSLLPNIAHLDFGSLVASRGFGPENLLNFAMDIVDREDIAMYLVLVEFYKDLFRKVHSAPQPDSRTRFVGLVERRMGDTAAVRAVGELMREAQQDEDLADFAAWVAEVVEDTAH